jgi:hypothetical protein
MSHENRPARRFDLEWSMPLEPGLMTHATLLDLSKQSSPVAVGYGSDEADTLLDLWTTLIDRDEDAAGIAYVAAAYTKRTGQPPVGPTR